MKGSKPNNFLGTVEFLIQTKEIANKMIVCNLHRFLLFLIVKDFYRADFTFFYVIPKPALLKNSGPVRILFLASPVHKKSGPGPVKKNAIVPAPKNFQSTLDCILRTLTPENQIFCRMYMQIVG